MLSRLPQVTSVRCLQMGQMVFIAESLPDLPLKRCTAPDQTGVPSSSPSCEESHSLTVWDLQICASDDRHSQPLAKSHLGSLVVLEATRIRGTQQRPASPAF